MKKDCYVGFDTSNYTTSAAICDGDGRIVANLKRPLPVKTGECGLRQSDALFSHIKNLPELCDELHGELLDYDIAAVGVSTRPRSVEGSYMPCFLAGVSAAHSFAAASDAQVCEFSHQDGHVMAALYSSGAMDRLLGKSFIALHVSGGTTEMLLAEPSENSLFKLTLIGETEDLNAGQVIDRVGVMMGLSFPCGRELEKLASAYVGKNTRSRASVKEKDGLIVCNLSGVENISKKLYDETGDKESVAADAFGHIERTLSEMLLLAEAKYGSLPVLFSGGVMSNKLMRKGLSRGLEAYFAEPAFSADNAAGIALLTYYKNKS